MAKLFIAESKKKNIRDFSDNNSNMIERSKENQTIHDNAEKVFNKIPLSITEKRHYKTFCSMKKVFNHIGLTRIMHL